MEVEYVLTEEDIVAMQDYYLADYANKRRPSFLGFVIVMLLAIPFAWFTSWDARKDTPSEPQYLPSLVLLLVLIGGILWHKRLRRWWLVRQLCRNLRKPSYAKQLGWRRVRIAPEGFTCVSNDETVTVKWGAITRIRTAKEHVLLYTSEIAAFIIPKRIFADEVALDEFVSTARAYRKESNADRVDEATPARKPAGGDETGITRGERAG